MNKFTGEYECKVDAKGRVRLPSSLVRQLPNVEHGFVINRGFEKHLILYPKEVWGLRSAEIDKLNIYNTRHRQAIRYFYRGATEVHIDSSDRLLLPRSLSEYAGIDHQVVLFAYQSQIEIWSKATYEAMIDNEPTEFGDIAHDIFGQLSQGDN